jgi:hypothetical protein
MTKEEFKDRIYASVARKQDYIEVRAGIRIEAVFRLSSDLNEEGIALAVDGARQELVNQVYR